MKYPKNLNAKEFKEAINSDKSAVILDVRTPSEYSEGHISNSILIDIYDPTFQNKILELDKTKNYYIYCRSGSRSYHAGVFMLAQGFQSVQHLEEGILSWNDLIER